jgi:hypothetical protein
MQVKLSKLRHSRDRHINKRFTVNLDLDISRDFVILTIVYTSVPQDKITWLTGLWARNGGFVSARRPLQQHPRLEGTIETVQMIYLLR